MPDMDVVITSDRIEVTGDETVSGARLYIRPLGHCAFKGVGYALKGTYLLSESAEVKTWKASHESLQFMTKIANAEHGYKGIQMVSLHDCLNEFRRERNQALRHHRDLEIQLKSRIDAHENDNRIHSGELSRQTAAAQGWEHRSGEQEKEIRVLQNGFVHQNGEMLERNKEVRELKAENANLKALLSRAQDVWAEIRIATK